MSGEHCWHMRRMQVLPGKRGLSLVEERCCWCAATRSQTVRSVRDKDHGPHVKAYCTKVVDADEVGPCARGGAA